MRLFGRVLGPDEVTAVWREKLCVTASCFDGIFNGNEDGVDCGGGDCDAQCGTCSDGQRNGDEEGIDCGGIACPSCGVTCSDGLRNGDEILNGFPQDALQGDQQAYVTLDLRREGRVCRIRYQPRGETVDAFQWVAVNPHQAKASKKRI